MEEANAVGDIIKMHDIAARLQGKGKQASSNISTDENGTYLVSEVDRLAVWCRYYTRKFSHVPVVIAPVQSVPFPSNHSDNILPASDQSPTLKEVETALKQLKSGKSPGIDEIPVELIRSSENAIHSLTEVIQLVWINEKLPHDWSKGLFVNIYKGKGGKNKPVSYRPVCLLSHAYKTLAVIILTRLRDTIDARIRTGQEGFRSGRGCADNVFVLRAAINYAIRNINCTKLDITLIDFTQAFDTVSHEFLQTACIEHGIPPKYCRLIQAIYRKATGYVKGFKGSMSEPFGIFRGVLQGDILSPILFVLCLNSVWSRSVEPTDGWSIPPPPNITHVPHGCWMSCHTQMISYSLTLDFPIVNDGYRS
jgi:Reverse transcriptase (RNA-dependent DNA polymerase)